MTTKLSVYNQALGHLRERKIASLSEAREPRRVLDDFYDSAIPYCLRKRPWNFAMRVVSIDKSTSLTPSFGFDNAFTKPSDWVRTNVISAVATFDMPLLSYTDESGYWYADCDPLYVQYVSSSDSYGGDLSLWPPDFELFFTLYLAWRSVGRIANSDTLRQELRAELKEEMRAAGALDAMDQPVGFPPRGTWVRSRNNGATNGTTRGWTGR